MEQLKSAVKTKDLIIEQLEEEKKDAVRDTERHLQSTVHKLRDELKRYQQDTKVCSASSTPWVMDMQ